MAALQHYNSVLKDNEITPNDFKLVLGDEIYLVDDVDDIRDNYSADKHGYYHFILLAKDKEGYRLLKEISSVAWNNAYSQRGMQRVPISKGQLGKIICSNPGHLIGSTACLGGQLAKLIIKLDKAEKEKGPQSQEAYNIKAQINDFMNYCKKMFGDDFYLEVQPSYSEEQLIVNKRIKSLSKFYGVKIIFTTDSHYLKKEDAPIHKAYLNSKEGEREVDDFYATAYMMEQEEVFDYLSKTFTSEEFAEMVANTHEIADKCEVYDLGHKQVIPKIDITDKLEKLKKTYPVLDRSWYKGREFIINMLNSTDKQDNYWIYSCIDGMHKKILGKPVDTSVYWDRINTEARELWGISNIIEDRMSKYYNTMQAIIALVWDKGNSIVGPARGSATGFLTCYLMDITQLDPIQWNLPHWRHLSETRPELPKDLCWAV